MISTRSIISFFGLAGVVLITSVAGVLFFAAPHAVAPQPLTPPAVDDGSVVAIESIVIQPSRIEDGWTFYQEGAVLVIEGRGLERVEIRYYPTGTGIGELYADGDILGDAARDVEEPKRWVYPLPEGLLTTNMWAVGYGGEGDSVRSQDLGNVGFETNAD